MCQAHLARAKAHRESLSGDPANYVVVNEEKRRHAVEDRIKDLRTVLQKSTFEPEIENISAVIAAYESGQIGYSKQFTLLWAGKVVETAQSYAEFAADRPERLDRYERDHGPGWLWWEGPLWLHPSEQSRAAGCQIIDLSPSRYSFGHFYINQVGFVS